ncbi:RIP metalloprotease [Candidatus Liberibacter africanus]|uniref:Zinc metallopeptidase n=1 Tax=Candidatus Liberibacter africanus PTSAPSY TaxID=1277257 RepID=A0A0G3I2K2_LIBAF|nr:M50 family metallopeptidase [Candidatus Liberibacter africanus]AKK20114.1 zinc metallopeptidase [Candidatus Liberibacter africanus PTSAPSY]QTP63922.1 RIP metalloprotease [Candidatus Liberibacter africanus]
MFGLDYLLLYIGSISIIVFAHEFGHYIVARLCNIRVMSFSIGFGPEIFGITDRSGTRWKISYIPLGGYVSFSEDEKDPRSFVCSALWKKSVTVLAGPFINYVMAILFFAFFFYNTAVIDPVVFKVFPGTPASIFGIKVKDRIVSLDGTAVSTSEDVAFYIRKNQLREVEFVLQREHVGIITLKVTPRLQDFIDQFNVKHKIPTIGILFDSGNLHYRTVLQSFSRSLNEVISITIKSFSGLIHIFSGDVKVHSIHGPVGIAKVAKKFAEYGFNSYIEFLAIFSWVTGFMNLLPIPILDGGNFMIFLFEMIRGKPLKVSTVRFITKIGCSFILFLLFLGISNDIYGLLW